MRISATSTLIDYYTKHPETEQALKAWIAEVKKQIGKLHTIEAIKFRMAQQGIDIKDLDGMIGKPNRVYEIFNKLGIGADVLIQV